VRAIHWLVITAILLAVPYSAYLYLADIAETWGWMLKVVGPTAPALIGLGAYVVVVLIRVFVEAPRLSEGSLLDRLDHAGDIGEVAGICGLLGTILAMAAASVAGKPDLAGFLQSLTSTLIGSTINALVIFISSLMRLKLTRSAS